MTPVRAEQGTVVVDGCAVAFRTLGSPDDPPVALVHGGGAHWGWWDRVAPPLALRRHVVLLDLSGHGGSDHRAEYGADVWTADIAAVLAEVTDRPAALVGHSMGGMVVIAAAARRPDLVDRLVLVDTRLPLRGLSRLPAQVRHYRSADEALSRFRLVPPQTSASADVLRELARANLVETAHGWRWRFDPDTRRRITNDELHDDLRRLTCPVGYVFGAASELGGPESARHVGEVLGRPVPTIAIPDAFHHVPIDQPDALALALDALLDQLDPA